MINAILGASLFLDDMYDLKDKIDEEHDKIIEEYEASMNYPRKKKKQVRKRLLLRYSINEYAKKFTLLN